MPSGVHNMRLCEDSTALLPPNYLCTCKAAHTLRYHGKGFTDQSFVRTPFYDLAFGQFGCLKCYTCIVTMMEFCVSGQFMASVMVVGIGGLMLVAAAQLSVFVSCIYYPLL